MQKLEYKVVLEDIGKSYNEILKNKIHISTRLLSKLINSKKIYVNNSCVDTRNLVNLGDVIVISFDYKEDCSNIIPTQMHLDIIYEDEWLLVLNKPAGIPIHPSRLHFTDSLCNGVKFYFDSINLNKKIRTVNRLDIGTSGVVIFAKCEYIQEIFIQQMAKKDFKKTYWCIVNGHLSKDFGSINLPIARKPESIIERCVSNEGQNCITNYKVLKKFNNFSLLECILETGRTHQIRVHMSSIGHSLVGDTLYGCKSNFIDRQALHSYKINCVHPITQANLSFIAKLPNDFSLLIQKLSKD